MGVHVFSFDFVVTSGGLQGQHGTEDYAYAFEAIGEHGGERRYRAFRVTSLGEGGVTTIALARNYAREFGQRHGNVRVDVNSPRSWPLSTPPVA